MLCASARSHLRKSLREVPTCCAPALALPCAVFEMKTSSKKGREIWRKVGRL